MSIRIINGKTLECLGTIDTERTRENIETLINSYVSTRGEIVEQDWSSESITIVTFADGTKLGFSV